jgi:hypothetical protein
MKVAGLDVLALLEPNTGEDQQAPAEELVG